MLINRPLAIKNLQSTVEMFMSGLFSFGRLGKCCAPMLVIGVVSTGIVNISQADELSDPNLSLDLVLTVVKENDFRLKQLQEESQAFLAESEAASYLPDPTVFAAIQSLPTDTFDVDQEPMTQLRVGVRQMSS